MSRRRAEAKLLPPCYARVLPGLETIAAEEIAEVLKGEVKRTEREVVVFRVSEIDERLLRLRTVEDVFVLAWGTDQLTYRAEDLERIRRWTARDADWDQLLRVHHVIRPRPKGKPSYRLVTQMNGTHGYRRVDACDALAQGLAGKLPASWRHVDEDAAIEIWLSIDGATAVCGIRLSDQALKHRTYKREHLPASLRPTLAAAMVRLANARPGQVVLDPMCGAGTILGESLERARLLKRQGDRETGRQGDRETGRQGDKTEAKRQAECDVSSEEGALITPLSTEDSTPSLSPGLPFSLSPCLFLGGDIDANALRAANINLRRLGAVSLARWDAARLPLEDQSVDRIISNPPFGKQLSRPEEIGPLYLRMIVEYNRVLRPSGRAVLLVSDAGALHDAIRSTDWKKERQFRVRVLGQPAQLSVWRKPS